MIRISEPQPAKPFAETKCGGCTALCCSYFALEIDAPDEPADFENLRWYIIHQDVNIFVDDEVWYLQVFRKCTWLDGKRCGHYEDRPQICRDYSDELCDFDGVESDLVFHDITELEAYRDEWVAKYEADSKKERAKKRRKKAKRAARKAETKTKGKKKAHKASAGKGHARGGKKSKSKTKAAKGKHKSKARELAPA